MYIHKSTSVSYCTTVLLKIAEEVSEARKRFMQRVKTKPEPEQSSSERHTINGDSNSFDTEQIMHMTTYRSKEAKAMWTVSWMHQHRLQ